SLERAGHASACDRARRGCARVYLVRSSSSASRRPNQRQQKNLSSQQGRRLVLADLRGATLVGRRLATPSARYGIALEQMLRLPISGPVVTAGRPRRLLLS